MAIITPKCENEHFMIEWTNQLQKLIFDKKNYFLLLGNNKAKQSQSVDLYDVITQCGVEYDPSATPNLVILPHIPPDSGSFVIVSTQPLIPT